MGRVDQWWNRHFPPYSWTRLGFGIAAIPFIGLLWYPINREAFTWGRYIAVTLMTQVFLAVSYWAIRNGRDELGEPKDVATGPITWQVPQGEPVPYEFPPEQAKKPTEPREPSDLEREAMAALATKRKPRTDPRIDFIASLLISFGAFIATLFMMVDEAPSVFGIGMAALVALMFTTALTFRYSVATVIGLSVALGLPVAYIARGIFYIMSFFSDQGSIWIWWLICSVGIFSFFAPGWYAMRRNRKTIEGLRIPNWVTTSLVSLFLVVCAAMATWEASPAQIASARPGAPLPPVDEVVASSNFGAGTRDEAVLRLYFAWKNGDRTAAQQVAHSQAVAALFALPFESSARPLGCGVDAEGYTRCVIRRSTDLLVLTTETTGHGRVYVRYFDHKPLDYPIRYNQPGATPSPTA